MRAPASVVDFIDVVRKSGLIPNDRLQVELSQFEAATASPATTDRFASALVRAALLTRFQAQQLKLGRYKRFEIAGKYRLLDKYSNRYEPDPQHPGADGLEWEVKTYVQLAL